MVDLIRTGHLSSHNSGVLRYHLITENLENTLIYLNQQSAATEGIH